MEERKEYRIGELYNVQNGLSKGGEFFGTGYPFVSFKTVFNNYFLPVSILDLAETSEVDRIKYSVKRGDILITRTSETAEELGMSCVALSDMPNATYNGFCKRLRPCHNDIVLPEYIGYLFRSKAIRSIFNSLSSMTTRASLRNDDLLGIKLSLPTINEQKKVASILRTIDTKIELNRRINDNLEQQAQTLFKSWLVDFDPFKNGKFVESEMGMIPEGWKVISLQEYCQEITRGNIPTYVEKSNRPILNQKVNKGVSLEKQYYKYNSENVEVSISKMAHYGDVLLNSLGQGTLGRVHLYKEKLGNVIIDQFITILRTNLFVKSAYLSYTLNRPEYQTIIEGNVTGSTGMWVLTINNVRNIKIIVPKESCFLELAPIINSIYQAISNNTAEMEQLCTLRDCILPHLKSGELKINDLNC